MCASFLTYCTMYYTYSECVMYCEFCSWTKKYIITFCGFLILFENCVIFVYFIICPLCTICINIYVEFFLPDFFSLRVFLCKCWHSVCKFLPHQNKHRLTLPAYISSIRLFSIQYSVFTFLLSSVFCLSVGPPAVFLSVCNSYIRISVWHPASESIEWIMEDQAFSPSYDVAPRPPPPPSPVSNIDRRHTGRLRKREKRGGVGVRGGAYPDETTARKLGSL